MEDIRRILVPVDFSDCSRAALEAAAGLARRHGAAVEVLHVHDAPWTPDAVKVRTEDGRELHPDEYLAVESERQLTELIELTPALADVEHGTAVRRGVAYEVILTRARAIEADLIVMGTHGRTGLRHLLMGSTSEKVMQGAPCPLLVVRDEYPD